MPAAGCACRLGAAAGPRRSPAPVADEFSHFSLTCRAARASTEPGQRGHGAAPATAPYRHGPRGCAMPGFPFPAPLHHPGRKHPPRPRRARAPPAHPTGMPTGGTCAERALPKGVSVTYPCYRYLRVYLREPRDSSTWILVRAPRPRYRCDYRYAPRAPGPPATECTQRRRRRARRDARISAGSPEGNTAVHTVAC